MPALWLMIPYYITLTLYYDLWPEHKVSRHKDTSGIKNDDQNCQRVSKAKQREEEKKKEDIPDADDSAINWYSPSNEKPRA